MVDRRIKAARFPPTKSLDTFDFLAMPSVNKHLVMQLTRCEYVDRRENVIAMGNSGTGKTQVALGLGLSACQRGLSVGFTTAAPSFLYAASSLDSDERLRGQADNHALPPTADAHTASKARAGRHSSGAPYLRLVLPYLQYCAALLPASCWKARTHIKED